MALSSVPPLPVRRRGRQHRSRPPVATALAAVASLSLLGACGSEGVPAAADRDGRLAVVASFYPVAEMAGRVGGNLVKVTNLTPPGVEPHDLELTSRQVDLLEDADLVVYLGQGFQPAVAEVAARRDSGSIDILGAISLEEGAHEPAEADEVHGGEEHGDENPVDAHAEESGLDPHFWLDPTLMAEAVDAVTGALVAADAENADAFQANAEAYKGRLASLDAELAAGLATCDRRRVVTSHAAFHYLARRYGLEQLAIAGLSPEGEPNPGRLAELTDEIRAHGITTVFFEELASPVVAEALAREAGVETAVLSPIEGLSKEDADAGKDYAAVMRENLAALRQALGCR